jgi:hypothetical protein
MAITPLVVEGTMKLTFVVEDETTVAVTPFRVTGVWRLKP